MFMPEAEIVKFNELFEDSIYKEVVEVYKEIIMANKPVPIVAVVGRI